MSNPLFYDGIIVLIFAVLMLWGYHRGLIMTMASVVVMVLSCVGATMVSDTLTPGIVQVVAPKVEIYLQNYLEEQGLPAPGATIEEYLSGSSLELFAPLLEQEFSEEIDTAIEQFTMSTLGAVAERITRGVVSVGLWLVVFLVLQILLSILLRMLDLVSKLPVLSTANALGGALVGALWAVVVLCVLLGVGSWFGWLPKPGVAERTVVYRLFLDRAGDLLAMLVKAV